MIGYYNRKNDTVKLKIEIDDTIVLFHVTFLFGYEEIETYDEEGYIKEQLLPFKKILKTLLGYYWEFEKKSEKINTFKLFKAIEKTGKLFANIYRPDGFIFASKKRFLRLYEPWFNDYNYELFCEDEETSIFLHEDLIALNLINKDNTI